MVNSNTDGTEAFEARPEAKLSRTWQSYMTDRVNGRESGIPWFLHDKLKCYRFCEENGLPTATVMRTFSNPGEIRLSGLDGEFVIKPTLQSSMKGVMVLSRTSTGFYDSLRRRSLSESEVIEEQVSMFNETKAAGKKIIVERKIADIDGRSIPRDFKAYSFRGRVALILEIDRNSKPSSVSWYDGDFRPIRDGRVVSNPKFVHEVSGQKPGYADDLLRLARRTSELVSTPFASIDMYATSAGPLVGEITLAPGGLYHGLHYTLSDAQQTLMGALWEGALADLGVE